MNHPAPAQHVPRRRSRGFNLIEIMLAMGIFVIGFVAIAAVFPVGALLQKQTMDLVITQSIGRNIEALFEARPYSWSTLHTASGFAITGACTAATNWEVKPISALPTSFQDHWSPLMRRYPLDNLSAGHQHKYYWVPMLQRTDPCTTGTVGNRPVQAFIFVLQRAEGFVNYAPGGNKTTIAPAAEWANPDRDLDKQFIPGVRGKTASVSGNTFTVITQGFAPGDKILDNLGTVHTVLSATTNQIKVAGDIKTHAGAGVKPSKVWFGWSHQAGAANPVRDIIQISNGKIAQ